MSAVQRTSTIAMGVAFTLALVGCSAPEGASSLADAAPTGAAAIEQSTAARTVHAATQSAKSMQVAGNLREAVLTDLSVRLEEQHGSGG